MTAATANAPATVPRAPRVPLAAPRQLMRLELRHSIMLWLLPLAIALFFFDTYRAAMTLLPYWDLRAMTVQLHAVADFGPFVAGAGAWTGSRDGRRHATELVAVTAVPRWAGLLATWAAATCWAEAAYMGCVAAVYGTTAGQGAWGGPLWWPVAVGVAAVAALCALGFAAGALCSSRFTAPLAAVAALFALFAALHGQLGGSTYALISPVNSSLGANLFPDIGVFYPYLPDLAIAEVMFLTGLVVVALGALGLSAVGAARRARWLAAAITTAGLAAAGTTVGLVGTARLEANGMYAVPALHDAASDRPISYTPACSHSGIPICLHPAFRTYLPDVTAALGPVLSQVAGLPRAPVRITQVTTSFYLNDANYKTPGGGDFVAGSPPVVRLPLGSYLGAEGEALIESIRSQAAPAIVASVVSVPSRPDTSAQQAVEAALLKASGLVLVAPTGGPGQGGNGPANGVPGPATGSPVYAAAVRFAALPAAARHAWLAAHLPALRTGRLTLRQLP
jgi:hypothetical protein